MHSIIEAVRDQPPKGGGASSSSYSSSSPLPAGRDSDEGVAVTKVNRLAGELLYLYDWYGLSTRMGLRKHAKGKKRKSGWLAGWLAVVEGSEWCVF